MLYILLYILIFKSLYQQTKKVTPSEVKLKGTFRAMNEEWRFQAHELIKKQTIDLVKSMGASADVTIDVGYPFVYNDIFFSSRRRHTRWNCDWSSDVCSSD